MVLCGVVKSFSERRDGVRGVVALRVLGRKYASQLIQSSSSSEGKITEKRFATDAVVINAERYKEKNTSEK